jgi:hypothetical protein
VLSQINLDSIVVEKSIVDVEQKHDFVCLDHASTRGRSAILLCRRLLAGDSFSFAYKKGASCVDRRSK